MKSYIGHSFTAAYRMPMPCSMKEATVSYSVVGIPAQINLWVISAVSPKVAFQSTSMGFWITSRAYWLIHPWSHSAVNNPSYQSLVQLCTEPYGYSLSRSKYSTFHTYDLWSATAIHASEIPQTANWLYQTPLPRESVPSEINGHPGTMTKRVHSTPRKGRAMDRKLQFNLEWCYSTLVKVTHSMTDQTPVAGKMKQMKHTCFWMSVGWVNPSRCSFSTISGMRP